MYRHCLIVLALVSVVACKKSEKEAAPSGAPAAGSAAAEKVAEPAKPGAQVPTAAGSAVAAVQDKIEQGKDAVAGANKPALTPEAYEKLIVGLEGCAIKGYEIDAKCPGMITLREGIKNSSTSMMDWAGVNAAVGRKLLGHAAVPVRLYAVGIMGGLMGTETSSEDAIVEAAAKEQDAGVRQAMIRTVGNSGAKNPKVGAFLLESADHPEVEVRKQAVYWISSSWNRDMKGAPEKLAAMMEGDKDAEVRIAACKYAGQLGVKALVAAYEKHTAKTDDPKMWGACLEGLVSMFHRYPLYETHEQDAYKLFVKRLGTKPRTKDIPPWDVMDSFAKANDDTNEKLVEWKKKAKWFKPADLRKALADVVVDPNANWMARNRAIESMVGLGATKKELEALKAKYKEPAGDDKLVVEELDEASAKAP